MASRIVPINWFDVTGGLNARTESFQLAPTEVPEILNMEIDRRGGFYTRKGWVRWNVDDVGAATWDPRNAYLHETAAGAQYVVVAVDGQLWSSSGGAFAQITGAVVAASPHLADFAAWGDELYVVCGTAQQSLSTTGSGAATLLTASGAAAWQEDTDSPVGGHMPKAEVCAVHLDRLFVGHTDEDSVDYPNRIRWSHPGSPEDWRSLDFQDIGAGGQRVVGMTSVGDHLLIFKNDSVWALFGYDQDSWTFVEVTKSYGAYSQQMVVGAEQDAYFFNWPYGVFRIRNGRVEHVSQQLDAIFRDLPLSAMDNAWMGWIDRRLWVSVPYSVDGTATDTTAIYVYDPTMGDVGAWMIFEGADGRGLGPFVERVHAGSDAPELAFHRTVKAAVAVNATTAASDTFELTAVGFESHIRTPWIAGEHPLLRKSWRRPDLVFRNLVAETTVAIESYVDYDSITVDRSTAVTVSPLAPGALWGDFDWGDGTVYTSGGTSTRIARGTSFGLARALQVRFIGTAGEQWGLNAVVLKLVPRRMR